MKLPFHFPECLFLVVIFSNCQIRGFPNLGSNQLLVKEPNRTDADSHIQPPSDLYEYLQEIISRNKLPDWDNRIIIPKRDGEGEGKQWVQIYFPDNLPDTRRRRKLKRTRVRILPKAEKVCNVFLQQEGVSYTYTKCLLDHILKIEEPNPNPSHQNVFDETPITFHDEGTSPPPTSDILFPWRHEWLKEYFQKIETRSSTSSDEFLKSLLEAFPGTEIQQ